MKFTYLRKAALLASAGLALLTGAANAAAPYTTGDLLLGFRATGNPGATQDFVVNLGQASLYDGTGSAHSVGSNLDADLQLFGSSWSTRSDVFWGISGIAVGSDPAKTVYASRAESSPGTLSTPWSRLAFTAQAVTTTKMLGMATAYANGTVTGNGVLQNTTTPNSYASYQPGGTPANSGPAPGTSFAAFNPSIEGTPSQRLDLYRVTPTSGTGINTPGQFVGYFSLSAGGDLTWTPAAVVNEATVHIEQTGYSISEAGSGTVEVKVIRGGGLAADPVTVNLSTTNGSGAVGGTDFTTVSGQQVSFAANETEQTVNITVANRAGFQGDRTFFVGLSSASGATIISPSSGVPVTIIEDDASVKFALATYNVSENAGSVLVDITRGGNLNKAVDITVSTANGTAAAPTHYTAQVLTPVHFDINQTTASVNIPVFSLGGLQGNRTFTVNLDTAPSGVGNISPTSTTVTITDATSLSLGAATFAVQEDLAGGVLHIPVNRLGSTTGITLVTVTTAPTGGNPAVAGSDYTAPSTTLPFADGDATKNIDITITDDLLAESPETFTVTLSAPSGGANLGTSVATVTISDPSSTVIALDAASYTVNEGSSVTVRVVRTGRVDSAVNVSFTTTPVAPATIADYTFVPATKTISFLINETFKDVVIPTLNDAAEANETFTVRLTAPQNLTVPAVVPVLGAISQASVTIIDPTSQTFVGVGADVAAPAATITSPANGNLAVNVTTGTTLNVTGGATDAKGVRKVQYLLNNDPGGFQDAVLVTPGATSTIWNAPIIPLTGTNTIAVRSVDFAQGGGNVAVASSKTTSPTVTLASVTLPAGLVINSDFLGRKITAISSLTVTLDGNANTGFGFVSVQTSAINSPTVTLASPTLPPGFGVGSTLLGRTVLAINSATVTLNGNANLAIAVATDVAYAAVVQVTASATNSNQVTISGAPPTLLALGSTLLGQIVTNIAGSTVTLAGNANALVSTASVRTSSTANATVTVTAVPATLVVGSGLLGQTVNAIVGTTITLSGPANATTTVATLLPYTSPRPYTAGVPFNTTERVSPTVVSTFKVLRNLEVPMVLANGSVATVLPAGFSTPASGRSFREVGKSFTLTAVPTLTNPTTISNPGSVFTGWTVTIPTLTTAQTLAQIGMSASSLTKPTVTFIFKEGLVISPHFDKNQNPLLAGTYNGLVHASPTAPVVPLLPGDDGITARNVSTEGCFTATLDAKGALTAKLFIDGSALSFLGSIDEVGVVRFGTARTTTMTVPRTGKPSLTVELHVVDTDTAAVPGGQQIIGTVTATDFKRSAVTAVSCILAERAFYGTAQVVTGKTTLNTPTVTEMATTTDRTQGELVTGAGIPANTTILSVNSPTQITLDKNATTAVAVNSLTFTRNVPAGYLGAASADATYNLVLPSRAPHYERDVTFDDTNSFVSTVDPNEFEDGDVVVFDSGLGPFPTAHLTAGDSYFVINKGAGTDPNAFQVTTVQGSFLEIVSITTPGTVGTASLDPTNRQTPGFEIKDYPQGDGIGAVKLSKTGTLTVTSTLADNTGVSFTTVTANSTLSSAGTACIFSQLYTLKGFLSTLVKFKDLPLTNTDADILPAPDSEVLWLRPFQLDQYYPYGWPEILKLDLQGAKYDATGVVLRKADNTPLLPANLVDGNATLTFSDGQLAEDMPPKVVSISTIAPLNMITKVPDPADATYDQLTITTATGMITGRFLHTSDDLPNLTTFQAIIFQKGPHAGAYGFFRTRAPAVVDFTGESGGVTILGN